MVWFKVRYQLELNGIFLQWMLWEPPPDLLCTHHHFPFSGRLLCPKWELPAQGLFVPPYMFMHAHRHTNVYTHVQPCTHVYTCVYMHVCAHVSMHTCIHARIAIHIPVYVQTHTHPCTMCTRAHAHTPDCSPRGQVLQALWCHSCREPCAVGSG